jgi:hypothetical protein
MAHAMNNIPIPDDRYARLRPPPATPADETCHCTGSPALVLQEHLSPNPVVCFDCAREVPPERVGYPPVLAEQIAKWRKFHFCFYYLWLDTAEFEAFARAELEDPRSVVNRRSLALVQAMNAVRRTYLAWFQHIGADEVLRITACPGCARALTLNQTRWVCERCSIAAPTG